MQKIKFVQCPDVRPDPKFTHYKDDVRFEPAMIQKGLNRYCMGEKYARTIVEGAARIDIHGNPLGIVTAEV